MSRKRRIEVVPGEKYGKLTVIKETHPHISPSGYKRRRVLCSCECDGKEVEVELSNLVTGRTISCGCVRKSKIKSGEVYGRLTVIGEAEPYISPKGQKGRVMVCQCSCGSNPIEVRLSNLKSGKTTSCGCVHKERTKGANKKYNAYDLTGDCGIGYDCNNNPFYFDLDSYELIKDYTWCIGNEGYVIAFDGNTNKMILMHRLIMDCPEDKVIDHIDHCKNNNCKNNLRICTQAENMKNRSIAKNNTSGITGVIWHKNRNKWTAYITINKKQIHLGLFNTIEEAIQSRLEAEKKYFGEFSSNKTMNT